jgi:hypothetical protein
MVLSARTALSAAEVDQFLGRHETGVLSLAAEDLPYAIPVSYGYDADERRFYLRLVATPGSEKAAFLGDTPRARMVVYENEGQSYHSVIASGDLAEIPRDELTVSDVEQYGDAKTPLFEMWGRDKRALDVGLYVLDPDELTGRTVEVEPSDD